MNQVQEQLRALKDFVDMPTVMEQLCALTPHDGRYAKATNILANYCSEAGLQRLRVLVEIEYLIHLNAHLIDEKCARELRVMYREYNQNTAAQIKSIEQRINHDVKAVEYFICDRLDEMGLAELKPHVHKFLTSEDVTNAAIGMMIFLVYDKIMRPDMMQLLHTLTDLAKKWKGQPMLARTHGQPASPTTVGKEFVIYASRIGKIIEKLDQLPITIKWNGASGNYNAHDAAVPEMNWIDFSINFVEVHLGFSVDLYTAQTNHYLYLADILHQYKNLCSVLIDLCQDMWLYISYDNFKLKPKEGEVGSSVMPHKVNPIDFENGEGNLGLAEVNFGYLASKLQKSRMQRDLSDSTTLRNLGVHFGSLRIALKSIMRGLGKIDINEQKLLEDLENNPAVLAEAIQSIMRECNIPNGYERLKELTRGKSVDLDTLRAFVRSLEQELPVGDFDYLFHTVPSAYIGRAEKLVEKFLQEQAP